MPSRARGGKLLSATLILLRVDLEILQERGKLAHRAHHTMRLVLGMSEQVVIGRGAGGAGGAGGTGVAGGVSFGNTGPYERLLGTASFAIDPNEKDLPFICDLEFAPRNPEGLVEFKTILDIVKPVDFSAYAEVVKTIKSYWLLTNEPPFPSDGR